MNSGKAWTNLGGWGGGTALPRPLFANNMICIAIPYCKHGDDMMFPCSGKHGWPLKSPEVGGGAALPPACLANNKDQDDER